MVTREICKSKSGNDNELWNEPAYREFNYDEELGLNVPMDIDMDIWYSRDQLQAEWIKQLTIELAKQ